MSLEFSIGFLKISLLDVVEVLLIGFLLYKVYQLIRGSVAVKVLTGFLFLSSVSVTKYTKRSTLT